MTLLAAALLVLTTAGRPATLRLSPITDGALVAGLIVADAGAWAIDRVDKRDPCPCDSADVPGFDRVAGLLEALARELGEALVGRALRDAAE